MAARTKVYIAVEDAGRRLVVDGDVALLGRLVAAVWPAPRRKTMTGAGVEADRRRMRGKPRTFAACGRARGGDDE